MKKIYLCGPTVYSEPHIGNIKPLITFDFLIRAFKSLKKEVLFVHNITDIDDKIIQQAIKQKTTEKVIASKYTKSYLNIMDELDIVKPNFIPSVVDNIEIIIDFIKKLVDLKVAYVVNGNVYFETNLYKEYGDFSNQKLDHLISEPNIYKKNVRDFALWKKTKEGMSWDSPWSNGRPGWHTECAAFIDYFFNHQMIDIHGGGIDLKFPHHENENIQLAAIYHKKMIKNWIHIGHLTWDDTKMSKSLNNVVNAQTILNQLGSNVVKVIFLLTNPLRPMDLSQSIINNAQELVKSLERLFDYKIRKTSSPIFANFIIELQFSKSLKYLHELIKKYYQTKEKKYLSEINAIIKILNLKFLLKKHTSQELNLIKEWKKLRREKKYDEADKLRNQLIKKRLI